MSSRASTVLSLRSPASNAASVCRATAQGSGPACATAASLFPFVGTIVYTIAPERIVIGGSVAELPGLFPLLRTKLVETLAGYGALPEHATDHFVAQAGLGGLAGPAGALVLAENALLAAGR